MARPEIPCDHEVRIEETRTVTENTENHRPEPAKDREVKRGRKAAKGYQRQHSKLDTEFRT